MGYRYNIFNIKSPRAYLSTIIDLYDRHVVAYKISKRNDNKLVMGTLNETLAKEKNVYGLIIYHDQGFQYTSYECKAIFESNGITISMARKGTLIDDSPIDVGTHFLKKLCTTIILHLYKNIFNLYKNGYYFTIRLD